MKAKFAVFSKFANFAFISTFENNRNPKAESEDNQAFNV